MEGIAVVSIEEVAQRNNLRLYPTSRPGQFKAHCLVCGDKGGQFHLYVSSNKDTFFCHKCGTRGGAVAFHAWVKGIDFAAAKAELYPQGQNRRPLHPAETLTPQQRDEMGFIVRKPSPIAPKGADQKEWNRYRRRVLDWMWSEWLAYERYKRGQTERLLQLLERAGRTAAS
jgi:hypothetical protein